MEISAGKQNVTRNEADLLDVYCKNFESPHMTIKHCLNDCCLLSWCL